MILSAQSCLIVYSCRRYEFKLSARASDDTLYSSGSNWRFEVILVSEIGEGKAMIEIAKRTWKNNLKVSGQRFGP